MAIDLFYVSDERGQKVRTRVLSRPGAGVVKVCAPQVGGLSRARQWEATGVVQVWLREDVSLAALLWAGYHRQERGLTARRGDSPSGVGTHHRVWGFTIAVEGPVGRCAAPGRLRAVLRP
eukprot:1195160-Prorocentrum_minimum.AAC.11